jgi:NAD(P) transhydrogenase subunit alpha
MRVAIPKENAPDERRVAMVPSVAARVLGTGYELALEHDAGLAAGYADDVYVAQDFTIVEDASSLVSSSDLLCKVQPPSLDEVAKMRSGSALVSFLQPGTNLDLVASLAKREISAFSLDLLPRISRAQSMEALSSQATVAGYRGALIAAQHLQKFFPMLMTAAGTVPPAKVLVLGAGVAGLQAIATTRRLGAVVRAYDVRPASREEVESLGAAFVKLDLESQEGEGGYAREQSEEFLARQRELIGNEVAAADVVISTAAVPGRRAPVLITKEMVKRMALGSVIVDLAAETGGNCELTEPGKEIVVDGVTISAMTNLPSTMATHASFLYARNVAELVHLLAPEGELALNFDDEIVSGACVTHAGKIQHQPTRELLEGRPQ